MRVAAVLSLALAGVSAAAPPPEAAALQKHLNDLIAAAEPSVACVLVSRSERYADFGQGPSSARDGRLGGFEPRAGTRFDPARRELIKRLDLSRPETVPESYGSGVVIDAGKGLVLTNYHVIGGPKDAGGGGLATKIYVRLPGANRGSYADIHAADPRADLAVLRMLGPPVDLKAIPLGDAGKLTKGDWVVGLSNPFAAGFRDGSPSASSGIVSNLRRRVPGPGNEVQRARPLSEYATLIQTDVRLHLGSSGGALLNLDGELVGLTTSLAAIAGGETPGGYALPMDANTRKMIDTLKNGEEIEYGFLGVTVNPEDRGTGRGVMIQDAGAGLPAARGGLLARDVIVSISGNPVREQDDLFLNIAAAQAGSEVEIEVERNGRRRTFTVRLAKSAQVGEPIASRRREPVHGLRVDYASTLSIDANPPEGVLVKDLEPGSPAQKKLGADSGRGNLIVTAVDGRPVPTPAEFYRLAGGKRSVTLDVVEVGAGAAPRKVTLP